MDDEFMESKPFLVTTSGANATAGIVFGFHAVLREAELHLGPLPEHYDWKTDPGWKYSNGEPFQLIMIVDKDQYIVVQRITAGMQLVAELEDKIDGLTSDLENAVEVAFRRGAQDWTRLNYPAMWQRLAAQEATTDLKKANVAPPEKPHVVIAYEHEFVMTPDTIDLEDGGMAMIVHADPDTPESDPNEGFAVRLHSWDSTKEHEQLRKFAGKFVKIRIEAFNV